MEGAGGVSYLTDPSYPPSSPSWAAWPRDEEEPQVGSLGTVVDILLRMDIRARFGTVVDTPLGMDISALVGSSEAVNEATVPKEVSTGTGVTICGDVVSTLSPLDDKVTPGI